MPKQDLTEYKTSLLKYPDFRRMLSNFYEAPFKLDGLTWNTVEHYYQASKFKKNNPEFYRQFALESGSELSKNPNMAKDAGGKSGKYLKEQIRPKSVVVDEDFFDRIDSNGNRIPGRSDKEMYDAQFAKFTQNENMRDMLLATKDARLMHIMPRSTVSVPFDNLVYIRNLMKKNKV